jgi:hypothetical protein
LHTKEPLRESGLLADAAATNRERQIEREAGHLPGTLAEALPYYRELIESHHAAMLAADASETLRLREGAYMLANWLGQGDPGILADDDSPGCRLDRETRAEPGSTPMWGQRGDFCIAVGDMRVRVEMDGIFGIGMLSGFWPGFSAHAVEPDLPFLSETGYRSFLGVHADPVPGLAPQVFVREILAAYVARELKGRRVTLRRNCSLPDTAGAP